MEKEDPQEKPEEVQSEGRIVPSATPPEHNSPTGVRSTEEGRTDPFAGPLYQVKVEVEEETEISSLESQHTSSVIGQETENNAGPSLEENMSIKLEDPSEFLPKKEVKVEKLTEAESQNAVPGVGVMAPDVISGVMAPDVLPVRVTAPDVVAVGVPAPDVLPAGVAAPDVLWVEVTAPDVLKYREEESGTDTDSDSSSSSDSSDESSQSAPEEEKDDKSEQKRSNDGNVKETGRPWFRFKKLREDIRTRGEVFPDELPPIEDLTITVDETEEMMLVGKVTGIVDVLVIIQSERDMPVLNEDTILFRDDRRCLGKVFEVFGPIILPLYSVRFTSTADIKTAQVDIGMSVYCAPRKQEYTHYVFVEQLKRLKGSDASWKNNHEPPSRFVEYSDDEEEKRTKAKTRRERQTKEDGTTAQGEEGPGEGKTRKTACPRRPRQHANGQNNSSQNQNSSGNNSGFNDSLPNQRGRHRPVAPGHFQGYHSNHPGQMGGPTPPNLWQAGEGFSQRHNFGHNRGLRGHVNFNPRHSQQGPRHHRFPGSQESGPSQNYFSNPQQGPNFGYSSYHRFSRPPQFGWGPRMGGYPGGSGFGGPGSPQRFDRHFSDLQTFADPFRGQMDGGGPSTIQQRFSGPNNMNTGPYGMNIGPANINAGQNMSTAQNIINTGSNSTNTGPNSMNNGSYNMDTGPNSMNTGPNSMNTGSYSMDTGPNSMNTGPKFGDAGPTSMNAGPTSIANQQSELPQTLQVIAPAMPLDMRYVKNTDILNT